MRVEEVIPNNVTMVEEGEGGVGKLPMGMIWVACCLVFFHQAR